MREYKIETTSVKGLQERLNQLGALKWKLIQIVYIRTSRTPPTLVELFLSRKAPKKH